MAKKKTTTRKAAASPVDGQTRILVLHGAEEMVAKRHMDAVRAALAKEHGEVEVFHFPGKSATVADVFDELRGYSLMMTYKLVVVDDADQWVKQHRDALERYAEGPVDHATLVLRAPIWNKGKVDKLIAKVGAVVKCEPPSPPEAAAWLLSRASEEHGVDLDKRAASLLVDRLGPHLMLLDTELAKLALMAPLAEGKDARPAVTLALVEVFHGGGQQVHPGIEFLPVGEVFCLARLVIGQPVLPFHVAIGAHRHVERGVRTGHASVHRIDFAFGDVQLLGDQPGQLILVQIGVNGVLDRDRGDAVIHPQAFLCLFAYIRHWRSLFNLSLRLPLIRGR